MINKKLDWLGKIAVETWCNGYLSIGKTHTQVIEMLSKSNIHSYSQLEHMKKKWKNYLIEETI